MLNSLHTKRPHSAGRVRLTYDALTANGTPSLEVVEVALFHLNKSPTSAAVKDESEKLEPLRAQLAATAQAWAGFEALQVVSYRTSPADPIGGPFRILSLRMPSDAAPHFIGIALGAMFDWSDGGKKIAEAGDAIEVLVAHTEAKRERSFNG